MEHVAMAKMPDMRSMKCMRARQAAGVESVILAYVYV